jgi:PmbA protein
MKKPLAGFAYSSAQFDDLIDAAFAAAKKLGVADCAITASEGTGLSVSCRLGALENVEQNRDKSLGITVYVGQQRGNAATSDFSAAAIADTVRAAHDIARYTAPDPCGNLPDAADMCSNKAAKRDLDLFHPWGVSSEAAAELALRAERAALLLDPRLSNSDGASVSAQQSQFRCGYLRDGKADFLAGYATSRHSLSVAPIAVDAKGDMQRDYWFSSERNAADLASPEAVGRYAAERTLSRLGAKKLSTRTCPVLFDAPLAAGLMGAFVQGISGGALYRKTSFLVDSLGQQIFPKNLSLHEDPFTLGGKGSSPFDGEGCRVQARDVVKDGVVQGYFLSSYSARKMQLPTTGNSGGSHNLAWQWKGTKKADDLPAMLRRMGRGLFVTELMGQGVNYLTGDYSRGASGYWVENGEIAYPVHEITIAGNLREMFTQIVHIGADVYTYGAKTTGSVLIEKMKIAGN